MIYLANQDDFGERHLQTREDAANQNQMDTAACAALQRQAGKELFSSDFFGF